MACRCEVGILTVARCLREGVGSNVRCFVDTKSGLREVEGFTGQPGAMQAVLMYHPRRNLAQLPVTVLLDTEVFLARRDLTGMQREDVLQIAEKAASVDALTRAQAPLDLAAATLEMTNALANVPDSLVEAAQEAYPTSQWQG